MNGVDKFDSDLNRYLFQHRKRKWTRCLLLFKMAIVNSYKIYLTATPRVQQITFILQLLNLLFRGDPRPPKPLPPKDTRSHLITPTLSLKECAFCWQGDPNRPDDHPQDRIAGYYCASCLVFLHPWCFRKYHQEILEPHGGH